MTQGKVCSDPPRSSEIVDMTDGLTELVQMLHAEHYQSESGMQSSQGQILNFENVLVDVPGCNQDLPQAAFESHGEAWITLFGRVQRIANRRAALGMFALDNMKRLAETTRHISRRLMSSPNKQRSAKGGNTNDRRLRALNHYPETEGHPQKDTNVYADLIRLRRGALPLYLRFITDQKAKAEVAKTA